MDITDVAFNYDTAKMDKEIIDHYRQIAKLNVPDRVMNIHILFGYLRILFRNINVAEVPVKKKTELVKQVKMLLLSHTLKFDSKLFLNN